MNDIVYCPRRLCQYPVSLEAKDKFAICPDCQYAFCIDCRKTFHGIEPCTLKGDNPFELKPDVDLSLEWIAENYKYCPICVTAIEKNGGCNKIFCTQCRKYFCWICKEVVTSENFVKHYYFRRGNGCRLYGGS